MPLLHPIRLAIAAVLLTVAAPAMADPRVISEDERIVGRQDAAVTIVEYASLTCPACARFHTEVRPELEQRYVEPGDVRIVYRDFPLDGLALAAAALARCQEDPERSLTALGLLYEHQRHWARAELPLPAMIETLAPLDVDAEQAAACLAREELAHDILSIAQAGYDVFDIEETPTFVINGARAPRLLTFDDFERVLEPLLRR